MPLREVPTSVNLKKWLCGGCLWYICSFGSGLGIVGYIYIYVYVYIYICSRSSSTYLSSGYDHSMEIGKVLQAVKVLDNSNIIMLTIQQ